MAEPRLLSLRRAALVLALLPGFAPQSAALAQGPQPPGVVTFDSPASDLKVVSQQQYFADIQQLQTLLARCRAKPDACDADKAGDDLTVAEGDGRFDVRRAWLRDALTIARGKSDAERGELMTKAADRLSADAQELLGPPATAHDKLEQRARTEANAILSRAEFRTLEQQGWLDTKWALLMIWLGALMDGFYSRLPHSSWVAPLLEWGLLSAAAVALIVWAWRVTQQQRFQVAVPHADRQTLWQKESDDWARRAEAQAAAGDWREAVHCLYWAAIVMMEARRFWQPNRARTPREYLPLLEAGSPRQRALGGLTWIFERIWYGLRPAARPDFERAQALLAELKAA